MVPHRKTVRHRHELGDFHELTFSCYSRLSLLTNDDRQRLLAETIDRANEGYQFQLVAFVFMPEHIHLLVFPITPKPEIDNFLKAIKRPFSFRIKRQLSGAHDPLLESLMVRERPGVECFRFWQEGPGYDRNLRNEKAVLTAIDYIHNNPVRRGLCERAVDWKWSSARHYLLPEAPVDLDLPRISGLPSGFLT